MSKINKHLDNSMPILERLAKIKKLFSSSATFWSVTRILMPFLVSQFIALGWNQKFSSIAMDFFKDMPEWIQSIVSLIVGYFEKSGDWLFVWVVLFLIVVMVFVKLIEKEEKTKHGFFFFSSFLLIAMSLWFYFLPHNESLARENSKTLKEIQQDTKVNNHLVDEVNLERKKYAQLQHKFDALRESVRKNIPNDREIIDNANKILKGDGIEGAIFYLKIQLSFFKASQKQEEENAQSESNEVTPINKETTVVAQAEEENNNTQISNRVVSNSTVTIDGLTYDNSPFTKRYTWEEAKSYCSEKGFGWRLPTRKELHKISNIELYKQSDGDFREWFEKHKNKRLKASNGRLLFVREEFLENMKDAFWFWISEEMDSSRAWLVDFRDGLGGWSRKTYTYYVLCVSGQ